MLPKRAVIVGSQASARRIAHSLTSYADWHARSYRNTQAGLLRALLALRKADVLVCCGGPGPNVALAEFARQREIPIVVVWCGCDVGRAADDAVNLELVKQHGYLNLADGEWLVDELDAIGISAELLHVRGVPTGGAAPPLPNKLRVLTFLPACADERDVEHLYALAHALPDIAFETIGPYHAAAPPPPNVTHSGLVDDPFSRMDAASVVLATAAPLASGLVVLEALSRARHVIWSYDFPGVHAARSNDEVLELLRGFIELHEAGGLTANAAARAVVLSNYAEKYVAQTFSARLESLLEHATRRATGQRRVAISGLALFCASMIEEVRKRQPQWDASILRTNSRLEVLTSIVTLARADVWYSIGNPDADRVVNFAARLMRKPRVLHWVGSDIDLIRDNRWLQRTIASKRTKHLTEVQWTADELRTLGVESDIAPLPPRNRGGTLEALPATFTVMLYVPKRRGDFYGRAEYERLLRHFAGRNVRFLIVGGGQLHVPPLADVQNLGWRERLDDAYREATVLVRYTQRDGLSLMVLEALSYGRYVLWTQDFPHTTTVRSYEEMRDELEELLRRHSAGGLQPRGDAAQMVAQHYETERCVGAIAQIWQEALQCQ